MFRQLALARARSSSAAFAATCLRDEQTGAPVQLATHHREMHKRWSGSKRSVTWAPSEFGKSQNLAAWIAWRLGQNQGLRIGLLSGTREQAARLLRAVSIVMASPDYQAVFPGVAIERQTQDELVVTGRPTTQKDPSIVAGSYDLSSLQGLRLDIAAADDVATRESIRTQAARDAAYQAFMGVVGSRVAPGGEIHVVNTAEHSDDVPHRLARLPGWSSKSFPALDGKGQPTWPQRWPIERIEQRRLELGPVGFLRAMMCVPVDESTIIFTQELIDLALLQGRDPRFTARGSRRVVIGVDPAWTTSASADESAIVLVAIDDFQNRHLTHIEAGRWHHEQLANRAVELARANKATVYCESNGAGGIIADMIGRRAPCKPLPTTRTSKQARVEALSAELASGRWCLSQPLGYPSANLKRLCDNLATFSFDSHCGDRLAALLIAVEGCRALESRPKMRWHHLDLTAR